MALIEQSSMAPVVAPPSTFPQEDNECGHLQGDRDCGPILLGNLQDPTGRRGKRSMFVVVLQLRKRLREQICPWSTLLRGSWACGEISELFGWHSMPSLWCGVLDRWQAGGFQMVCGCS